MSIHTSNSQISIPKYWAEKRLKDIVVIRSGDAIDASDVDEFGLYPIFGGGQSIGYFNRYNTTDDEIIVGRVGVKCGCVTFPNTKAWATDNALILHTIDNINYRFLYYLLTSLNLNSLNNSAAQPLVTASQIRSVSVVIPPISEQQKIVAYLDDKIASINSYIDVRSKELDLLKSFKQSKIAETVTHGLKANVPIKSSPFGDIPVHWEVRRTKDVCSAIFTGATPSTSIEEYWDGDIPWLPSGCCHDCYVTEAPRYITQAGLENSSTRWIPKGTTVMAITGATCAQLGSLKIDACANQSVVAFIEEKDMLDARFLFHELRALRDIILTNRTGGAQAGIDTGDCMNIIISLPPLSEQQEIAKYLDEECEKIDKKCALIEKQIEKLQLLKRALINEVVTGKRKIA